jgi:hypothetical protein
MTNEKGSTHLSLPVTTIKMNVHSTDFSTTIKFIVYQPEHKNFNQDGQQQELRLKRIKGMPVELK